MAEAAGSEKPAVLIVGGLGFLGRYLALHIHKNELASEIRIVDKVLPQLAWLAPEFVEACSQDQFMQADASKEQSLNRIFTPKIAKQYSYVFNCGGETRYSQDDSVYELRSVALTRALAGECVARNISAYIEFSSGMVYKPPASSLIAAGGCVETSPLKPWLKLARHKLAAEECLADIRAGAKQGTTLNYTILRLAHVYGEYDSGFLSRALCLARVYQAKKEPLKWLYGKDLRINTVHVLDVCSAAWAAAEWCASQPAPPPTNGIESKIASSPAPATASASSSIVTPAAASNGTTSTAQSDRIFNIVDEGDTAQAQLAAIVGALFHIDTGFQNALVSTFAKFNLESVVDDVNEDVLQPWADLLAAAGITRAGPIGPFMEKELLRDCDLCLNAERAHRLLHWAPASGRERISEARVGEVLDSYRRMGWWP